jgi:hypothetical protein
MIGLILNSLAKNSSIEVLECAIQSGTVGGMYDLTFSLGVSVISVSEVI